MLELVPPVAGPKRHPANDVVSQSAHGLVHLNRVRGGPSDLVHKMCHLSFPHAPEGVDSPVGEELRDAHFADVSPVVAVGGEGEVEEAVGEFGVGVGVGEGPGAAVEVVGAEDLLGEVGGGDDEGGDAAEVEEHDGAVVVGEVEEGAVGEGADLVEVAYYGEFWG